MTLVTKTICHGTNAPNLNSTPDLDTRMHCSGLAYFTKDHAFPVTSILLQNTAYHSVYMPHCLYPVIC